VTGCLASVDVLVLAGGLGTRLRGAIGDIPKVLAPIEGRPFIDHLFDLLAPFEARRIVFSLGHLAEKVVAHVEGMERVETVIEPEPLGTAGAVRFARDRLDSDPVMIMNGDTLLRADYCAFLDAHRRSGCEISLLCVDVPDASRYGRVDIRDERVRAFVEKDVSDTSEGAINGGIYLMSAAGLDGLMAAQGPSLEKDFLERQAPGALHAYVCSDALFVDIGTPQSLGEAAGVVRDMAAR
jgi:NDP-sugar pyrophosphorylase family protein